MRAKYDPDSFFWLNKMRTVVIIVLLILIFLWLRRERFTTYLDQMAMESADPTLFKWTGNERDIAGMSPRDYYLENETYALSRVRPWLFRGNQMFKDHTCYLGMPRRYRPDVGCFDVVDELDADRMDMNV